MKVVIKPILAIVLFVLWQFIVTGAAAIFVLVNNQELLEGVKSGVISFAKVVADLPTDVLALTLIVSGILTIVSVIIAGIVNKATVVNPATIRWKWAPVVLAGAFCGIFATDLLMEWFPLKNNLETQFLGLSHSFWGIVAIAIVGPITEEIVFRESIIGCLVKSKVNCWLAIFLSAACFGLIHGNPIQIPFAMIVGVIFGVVYFKTGNIVFTSIIHIINNSFAVIQMNIYDDEASNMTYKGLLGNMDIPLIILLSLTSICIIYRFWKNYKPIYI